MWGENQHALFRDAKTDPKSFYKAVIESGGACVCAAVRFWVFFGARQREGLDYVMVRGAGRERRRAVWREWRRLTR